jgi:hypothetical protein
MGFTLPLFLLFNFVRETGAFGDNTFFLSVSNLDLTCVCPISTSHKQSMFFTGSTNEFRLHWVFTSIIRICKPHEVFKTTLCNSFERTELII